MFFPKIAAFKAPCLLFNLKTYKNFSHTAFSLYQEPTKLFTRAIKSGASK